MLGFAWHHILVIVVVLVLGFYLGKTYPGALSGVPVLSNI